MDKYKGENLDTLSEPKWQLLSTSFFPNKDLSRVKTLAEIYLTADPDILMLTEVGGEESLQNFNKYFLSDKYNVIIKPSNSDRGIDLGYMVKKSLPFETQLIAHTEVKLDNGQKFARGVFELQLLQNKKPIFINLLCHLKSKLDFKKTDFEGRGQRDSEVKYLKNLFLKLSKKYPDIPILISGDLNAIIYKNETEPEVLKLFQGTGLVDIFEAFNRPIEERFTYCYFDSKRDRFQMQLDYILIEEAKKNMLAPHSIEVVSLNPNSATRYPKTFEEKLALPSDHYPVQCTISLVTI